MIASGSPDGSDPSTALVATSFTQSVEPGSGTSSTLIPAFSNQPSFCAIANGAAAELTVLAHQPTRTVRTSAAAGAASAPSTSTQTMAIRFIDHLLSLATKHRRPAKGPRTGSGAAPGGSAHAGRGPGSRG